MTRISRIPIFVAAFIALGLSAGSHSTALATYVGSPNVLSASATAVPVVNKDQFEGNWKQFKGDLKRQWGKFTDDDLLVIEGNYDKFEGRLQERYGDKKEEVQRWTDEWFKKHPERSAKGR